MTDVTTQVKPPEGSTDSAVDTKVDAPDKDQQRLKAAHDQARAEARKANKSVADLTAEVAELKAKANETPKEDTERLAALEVDAARSKAALKHGLSLEDAERLKGTPAEIMEDAEYWAAQRKEKGVTGDTNTDTSNRDTIDKDVAAAVTDPPPTKPKPKGDGNLSWMEEYKAGTPADRYKMDEDWKHGRRKPF